MSYFKSGYAGYIWNFLLNKIGNEYGVAGLMGNLYAESHLYPDMVEGDTARSGKSETYTADVDSGRIDIETFVNYGYNGSEKRRGYGLAQWTFRARKRALYNMWKSGGYRSIGCIELALDYLWYELTTDYKGVLSVLQSADSLAEASDKVLVDFENPAEYHYDTRRKYGQVYYDEYAGTGGDETPPSTDEPYIPPSSESNAELIAKAVTWAKAIANDDSHGYDQENRWGLDYDCSSLVIQAYEYAGVPVKTNGATSTSNMLDVFTDTGFTVFGFTGSSYEPMIGDVLWRDGHVAMYVGDNQLVEALYNENGETTGGVTGDQTGKEICLTEYTYEREWWYVLRLAGTFTPVIPAKPKHRHLPKILLYAVASDRF